MKYSDTEEGKRILAEQKSTERTPVEGVRGKIVSRLIPTDEDIRVRNEELDARDNVAKAVVDPLAEQTILLRSIRNYIAWAFWLAVAPAIAVALIYLAVIVAK